MAEWAHLVVVVDDNYDHLRAALAQQGSGGWEVVSTVFKAAHTKNEGRMTIHAPPCWVLFFKRLAVPDDALAALTPKNENPDAPSR